ncbi:MAG TPA: sporulation transcriptional regulator SpoIIID [Bacillota bacterium]|nr:sporulation transcriptional regulator SpoIIID [Bacillota bacterium]
MQYHKSVRHIRGGEATKRKYQTVNKQKDVHEKIQT